MSDAGEGLWWIEASEQVRRIGNPELGWCCSILRRLAKKDLDDLGRDQCELF